MRLFNFTLVLILAFIAGPAGVKAADWEEVTVKTTEGDTLVIGKRGRASYSMRIDAVDKADAINCVGFYGLMKTPLALSLRTAGERAESGSQVGAVVDYSESLRRMTSDKNAGAAAMFGAPICALGIDAFPGAVTMTLGTTFKMHGAYCHDYGGTGNEARCLAT